MVFSAAEIAIVLLVVWTASSFVPFVPSGVLAALTVIGYTYTTGFTEPSLTRPARTRSRLASGLRGGTVVRNALRKARWRIDADRRRRHAGWHRVAVRDGPIGLVVGVGGTVFLGSLYENGAEPRVAVRQSVYAVIGVFAGPFVQAVILAGVAVAFAISVL